MNLISNDFLGCTNPRSLKRIESSGSSVLVFSHDVFIVCVVPVQDFSKSHSALHDDGAIFYFSAVHSESHLISCIQLVVY